MQIEGNVVISVHFDLPSHIQVMVDPKLESALQLLVIRLGRLANTRLIIQSSHCDLGVEVLIPVVVVYHFLFQVLDLLFNQCLLS